MGDLISRQAAIRKLKRMAIHANIYKLTGRAETVINCCIDVIERQIPSAQPKSEERKAESAQNVTKEDLISRKAAIDEIEERKNANGYRNVAVISELNRLEGYIMRLPSAQPEIIRCKDCKHHWTHRCMDSMPTEICDLNQTFYDPNIDFCSLAERRTNGVDR